MASKLSSPNRLRVESLETRDLMAASPLPVLMVLPNQDFYYKEYADTRQSLEAAGLAVQVAASTTEPAVPHGNSGQAPGATDVVTPDVALASADAEDYSAIVFVGGWGASSYQYAFAGTYQNAAYNGDGRTEQAVNELVNDFVAQDKYVCGLHNAASDSRDYDALCSGIPIAETEASTGPYQGRRSSGGYVPT